MDNVSFDLPTWLVVYYHCIGTVSLILNCGTIFLVLFKSDTIDNFRYCILIFQILCTITDFHLTFLMEPIPLFPIIAGYCVGFLAQYLNVWSHYLMAFMVSIMSAQMEWLVYCFMKKHQTLAKILCRHVCNERLFFLGEVGMPILPVLVFMAFCKAGMEKSEQLGYVREAERQQAFDAKDFKIAGRISEEINMRVIEFNLDYPKEGKYLDLHYMTEKRAINFVTMMCNGNPGLWKLETDRGNNSPGNIPVIKRKLLEIYEGSIWVDRNEGILLLKVL
ncbi:hypothetical protein CAEBREN_13440 [Caenorhabditis brenneri]|uniref:Uncharacterized protein n=1 Tax=Caenorhabditis brenneri TaxID=135651 RepID=G0NL44_CAEBE|nr:hypothetical protein CAEBREN_13440 [Caenorhabditis brenneri]